MCPVERIFLKKKSLVPHFQNHLFFGYSGFLSSQRTEELFLWFRAGKSRLINISSLVDHQYNRLINHSFFCGYVGAAIALQKYIEQKKTPNKSNDANNNGKEAFFLKDWGSTEKLKSELFKSLTSFLSDQNFPKIIIFGSYGAAGKGAIKLLHSLRIPFEEMDRTGQSFLSSSELLSNFDILLNCVSLDEPSEPFLSSQDLIDYSRQRRLSVIGDISCGGGHPHNVLPIYDEPTTFEEPFKYLSPAYSPNITSLSSSNSTSSVSEQTIVPPLCLFGIENLNALVSDESQKKISEGLFEIILELEKGENCEPSSSRNNTLSPVWTRAFDLFSYHSSKYSEFSA
eukprot:TRINITY_DN2591_c0_g1_i2.p1 TRINITY_DN2591_c0_g1~~TRINITY_DN2591_c0_g1_i2.p1  ORF type:complete len:342 (-),score=71.51 TRINITY_DN2591_c0_g1_i2:369-1394(-)